MANGADLRKISLARLKTASTLTDAKDWVGAVYMMAWALECALKSCTCKTLNLLNYPENTKRKEVDSYFMTHKFHCLLTVSGLEQDFGFNGSIELFSNWSEFTSAFPTNWPEIRYDRSITWDEVKTRKLYTNLVDENHGLITYIKKKRKW